VVGVQLVLVVIKVRISGSWLDKDSEDGAWKSCTGELLYDFGDNMRPLHRLLPIWYLFFIFCFFPLTSPAASGKIDGEPIVIAAIFAQTGIAALHNKPLIEMISLTVDQLNREGGVLGRPLKLRVLDNKSCSIGALEAAREAVAAGVTAVIGSHWSSHSLAMAPTLQMAGIPMITPASTHPDVTRNRDYVFRTCFVDSAQGEAMARFAIQNLGVETTVVLRNIDEQYSVTIGGYFNTAFTALGGKVLLDTAYRGNTTDFSSIITQLQVLQPDTVYIPGYTRDTALFMKQARKNGIKAIFLGGDGWDMLEELIPNEVEGSFQTASWHPGVKKTESRRFLNFYGKDHTTPLRNLTIPLAYDAVMLVTEAIRKAGSTDRKQIRDALAATAGFEGATGSFLFDEDGNPHSKNVIIVCYVNGKTVFSTTVKSLM
jgi:branched-chain amino acid transport system substrate-binding protein